MSRNDGKEAETLIRDCFEKLQMDANSTYVRLYDTTSAGAKGNFIPEQPADFIIQYEGRASLVEVKSSNVHTSLSKISLKGFITPSQLLGVRTWTRAKAKSFFIFYSITTKLFEFWKGEDILSAIRDKRRVKKCSAIAIEVGKAELYTNLQRLL